MILDLFHRPTSKTEVISYHSTCQECAKYRAQIERARQAGDRACARLLRADFACHCKAEHGEANHER